MVDHHQRGDDVGGGEERRQLGARDQLHVAQRRAFAVAFAAGQAERFAARKARRNHPLVAIRSFVHPACRSTSGDPGNRRAFKARLREGSAKSSSAELENVEIAGDQRVVKRPRLGIDPHRDRAAPLRILGQRLDQRLDELAAALRGQELLERAAPRDRSGCRPPDRARRTESPCCTESRSGRRRRSSASSRPLPSLRGSWLRKRSRSSVFHRVPGLRTGRRALRRRRPPRRPRRTPWGPA